MRPAATSATPLVLGRPLAFPPFVSRPPWFGGDLQTIRNSLVFAMPDLTPYPDDALELPVDGDTILARLNRQPRPAHRPLVVLIHGLTGDENSRNIMRSAAFHLGRGHPVLRFNLRGAGPSLPHARAHYHAGRSEDLRAALAALPASLTERGIVLIGVSLGGNMLLKFMAEGACEGVIAAASVSAPIDLKAAQLRIMAPRNVIYHQHLLKAMKAAVRMAHPAVRERGAEALKDIRTIYEFDDRIVAPANGFTGAEDYYRRASAAPLLNKITHPTLLVHARNDPWIPAASYLARHWQPDGALTLALPPDGGHVGFHGRGDPQPWHDRIIGSFIEQHS